MIEVMMLAGRTKPLDEQMRFTSRKKTFYDDLCLVFSKLYLIYSEINHFIHKIRSALIFMLILGAEILIQQVDVRLLPSRVLLIKRCHCYWEICLT